MTKVKKDLENNTYIHIRIIYGLIRKIKNVVTVLNLYTTYFVCFQCIELHCHDSFLFISVLQGLIRKECQFFGLYKYCLRIIIMLGWLIIFLMEFIKNDNQS